ncbi:MAG: zinc-ribbon domain-containing protein, partial [Planctomycetales bacterium]|nr:zinc-ribbon domain-containing protein [Planctomycetales bacterium]NIP69166.1 zinc-ribbon domain-containing protein [Planctomycetales bacterium]
MSGKISDMICPNCRTENPEGAKFCNQCGSRLAASCPNCGHQNPPEAKFCNECGARLEGTSADPAGKETASPAPPTR